MASLDRMELTAAARPVAGVRVADRARAGLLLAGIAACYVAVIAVRPLVAPDEFRYAEVPREMIASGDWIAPRIDGLLYFEKPPLGYWLTALSMRAFGENAAAVRLPFALSTLLTAVIVFALARRYGSRTAVAPLAALGLLTSLEVMAVGSSAVLDALFALGTTATIAALFAAIEERPGTARQGWLAVSGAACGAAFLTKGFLAFAIPISVAVPYLVWSRRSGDLLRLPWTPLVVALAIAAPWSAAITRVQPDFWHQFVVNEHLRRFAGSDAQHAAPFWYFVPVVAVGALPWITLLADALRHRVTSAGSPLLRFCVCWFAAPLAMFSASSGKLATYVLPCFAPLFILLADRALALPRERLTRHLGWIAAIGAALGPLAAVVLLALPAGLDAFYAADAWAARVIGAVAALVAGAVAASALRTPDAAWRATAIAGAASLGLVAAAFAFPSGYVPKTPERWLAQHVAPVPEDAIVVADRTFVQAVCWHLRRADVLVLGSEGELRYGLEQPDQTARPITTTLRVRAGSRISSASWRWSIRRARRTLLPVELTPDRTETSGEAVMGVYDPQPRNDAGPSPSASARSDT